MVPIIITKYLIKRITQTEIVKNAELIIDQTVSNQSNQRKNNTFERKTE